MRESCVIPREELLECGRHVCAKVPSVMAPADTIGARLTERLGRAPRPVYVLYATVAAFSTYFCMYAFRKPFAVATFAGQTLGDSEVNLKTAFVISQILGYALSKFLGIKVCSEL